MLGDGARIGMKKTLQTEKLARRLGCTKPAVEISAAGLLLSAPVVRNVVPGRSVPGTSTTHPRPVFGNLLGVGRFPKVTL